MRKVHFHLSAVSWLPGNSGAKVMNECSVLGTMLSIGERMKEGPALRHKTRPPLLPETDLQFVSDFLPASRAEGSLPAEVLLRT